MSTLIRLKRSTISGKAPLPTALQDGEVAINTADGRLYYKDSQNTVKYFDSSAITTAGGTINGNLTITGSLNAKASKAISDQHGNVIDSTYATITSVNSGLAGKLGKTEKAASATVADSATKLSKGINVTITGAVSGSATAFDGSAPLTITTTSVNGAKVTGTVPSAIKATQDANGQNIVDTYATKGELTTFGDTIVDAFNQFEQSMVSDFALKSYVDGNFAKAKDLDALGDSVVQSFEQYHQTAVNEFITKTYGEATYAKKNELPTGALTQAIADKRYLGITAKAESAKTADSVTWTAITGKPGTFVPSAHNQASNTINAMTGYSKPSSTNAITATDSLNAAIGKIEKALDGKQATGSYALKSELTALTQQIEQLKTQIAALQTSKLDVATYNTDIQNAYNAL